MKSTRKQPYVIPFRILPEGLHRFDYQLDNSFFESYDALSDLQGELDVIVAFLKQDSKKKLEVNLKGTLLTTCDRCLEPMKLPFEAKGIYYIREAEEGEEEKEDVVFVASEDTELDLSQLFYELIMIGLPQKKMHKEEECNPEMLQKLETLTHKEEEVLDPRWKDLEKLIKKRNK